VAIYPPLHKFLLELSTMVFWDLQFFGMGCVLAMFSAKHVNMIITKNYVGFKEVSLKATQSTL
jgi:hypothetical protein